MQDTEIRDAMDVAKDRIQKPYIVDGPKATIYHKPFTTLHDTSYTVELRKDQSDVIVEIHSKITMERKNLENLIQVAVIEGELIPAGLVPVESTKEQMPYSFLRKL